jgi:hypothetical protein
MKLTKIRILTWLPIGLCGAVWLALSQTGLALPDDTTAIAPSDSSASTVRTTAGVACPLSYSAFNNSPNVNATSTSNWACTSTARTMTANGIPDHAVTGGNFATPISTQNLTVNMPVSPILASTTPIATIGYVLNGVKMDPATNGSCTSTATSTSPGGGCVFAMGSGPWILEAFGGAFVFGTDENNAHVQPNGQYHYHAAPEGYINSLNLGQAMTLVGFAVDGFPIYARYGYTVANDPNTPIKLLIPSYRKKAVPDAGRPSVTIFPMGTFTPDYEYVAGLGDLDECNGRTGVTPQFPNGIYHYVITETFPYIQRCIKGDRTIPTVLFANGFE